MSMKNILTTVALVAALTGAVRAETIFNTILDPETAADNQANLTAAAGQSFMTGTLGVSNTLSNIEIQAASSGTSGTLTYLAVYEDADGDTTTWGLGALVAVSTDANALATSSEVVSWHFSDEVLSDNTAYVFTFTSDAAGAVLQNFRVGLESNANSASDGGAIGHVAGEVFSDGLIPFGGAFDIAAAVNAPPPPVLPFTVEVTQPNSEIPRFGRNGLLRVNIYSPQGGVTTFDEITFALKDDSPDYITGLYLLNNGDAADLNGWASEVFADPAPTTNAVTVSVNALLAEGDNVFWLAVTPERYATLGGLLDARVNQLVLSGANGATIVPPDGDPAGSVALAQVPYSVDIRKAGAHGLSCNYRIPGIACDTNGVLHAVYDNRYNFGGDLPGDVDVAYNRSTDGGATWEPQQVIMDYDSSVPGSSGNGVGDPCILHDPVTDTLWVAALWSFGNNGYHGSGTGIDPADTGQYVLTKSTDGGTTWSAPINITADIKHPNWNLLFQGPGHGLAMRDGTLVFPSQLRDGTIENDGINQVRACSVFSTDHGATWQFGSVVPTTDPEQNENTVCELDDGRLLFSCRTPVGSNGERAWVHYTPGGTEPLQDGTWDTLYRLPEVPDPVCQGSVLQWKSTFDGHPKEWLLFANPATGGRNGMTLRVSIDGGLSWPISRLVYAGSSAYSSLCILPDNTIGLLYEKDGTSKITFVRVEEEWLLDPDADFDGDGMSDSWETLWGTNPTIPDADADPDVDDVSNIDEMRAGTDPQDAGSRFWDVALAMDAPSALQLAWDSIPGKAYAVSQSDDLITWTTPVLTVVASGPQAAAELPLEEGVTKRFYRTVVVP